MHKKEVNIFFFLLQCIPSSIHSQLDLSLLHWAALYPLDKYEFSLCLSMCVYLSYLSASFKTDTGICMLVRIDESSKFPWGFAFFFSLYSIFDVVFIMHMISNLVTWIWKWLLPRIWVLILHFPIMNLMEKGYRSCSLSNEWKRRILNIPNVLVKTAKEKKT